MKKIEFKIYFRDKRKPVMYNQEIDERTFYFIITPPYVLERSHLISDENSRLSYQLQDRYFALMYKLINDILESKLGIEENQIEDSEFDFDDSTVFYTVYL